MSETKKYVEESALSSNRDTKSGERGRIFDPIARIREAFTRLTSNVEQDNRHVVTDMFITLKHDLDSDPGNRERMSQILTISNHDTLANVLSEYIDDKSNDGEESKQIAGAIAELYIRQLMTFRAFEDAEGSRHRGHDRYNRTDLLGNAASFSENCLRMGKFVQDRESQDALRFATGEDSPKRIRNIFDRVIRLVNDKVGIKFTKSNIDGNQAFNFSRIRDAVAPTSGYYKSKK